MEEQTSEHKLESGEHIQTFMIHFFRSEANREMQWRRRLDVTASGAVVVTGGILSFAFTNPNGNHVILLINNLLLLIFILIEARRHQEYAKMKYRVRRMERDYIAPLFNQIVLEPRSITYQPNVDAGLVDSMLADSPPISRLESIAWRLRGVYIYLFSVTYIIWLFRILNGRGSQTWLEHINQQARIGSLLSSAVLVLFTVVMLAVWVFSLYMTRSSDASDYLV